mmetsp:Transcript_11556/g.19664  ORF Transcript_11556/g.19664 Transcript_11556/m.19664 type:complete len:227 (+) Transcript_11556:927-1607(+)
MTAGKVSKDSGTKAPASFRAEFLASADSLLSPPDFAPACPNCTSVGNILAQVPETQAQTGFVISPFFMASTMPYSFVPPSSPSTTIILTSSIFSNLSTWSRNVDPGYTSPPIAIPSKRPLVVLERMLYISFERPPDFETNPTEPGLYSLHAMMLSTVPAVSPILKDPAWMPPTVAGPMMTLPSLLAAARSLRTSLMGTPSAMITTVRIEGIWRASRELEKALRWEA